jgi:hypothetical protein
MGKRLPLYPLLPGLVVPGALAAALAEAQEKQAEGETIEESDDAVGKVFRQGQVMLQKKTRAATERHKHHRQKEGAVELSITFPEGHSTSIFP